MRNMLANALIHVGRIVQAAAYTFVASVMTHDTGTLVIFFALAYIASQLDEVTRVLRAKAA